MSTLTGDGVMQVRSHACDDLLAKRVEAKLRAGAASLREGSSANRLYVARPKVSCLYAVLTRVMTFSVAVS